MAVPKLPPRSDRANTLKAGFKSSAEMLTFAQAKAKDDQEKQSATLLAE